MCEMKSATINSRLLFTVDCNKLFDNPAAFWTQKHGHEILTHCQQDYLNLNDTLQLPKLIHQFYTKFITKIIPANKFMRESHNTLTNIYRQVPWLCYSTQLIQIPLQNTPSFSSICVIMQVNFIVIGKAP